MQRVREEDPAWEQGSLSGVVLWPIAAYTLWAVAYYLQARACPGLRRPCWPCWALQVAGRAAVCLAHHLQGCSPGLCVALLQADPAAQAAAGRLSRSHGVPLTGPPAGRPARRAHGCTGA